MEGVEVAETINYCLEDIFRLEDIDCRRLYLNGEIDKAVIDSVVYHILRYNRLDKDLPVGDREPIVIYLNSPGGDVTAGFGVIDAILTSKTPVYTVNLAECYSMCFLIFLSGSKRFSMPSATYLCHDGMIAACDSASKMKDRMEFEIGQMEQYTKDYVLSRTSISEEDYDKNYRKEWYFYPDEAKKLGVVTHIVGKDCEIDEIL